nr:hypothetical protein [Tanacetum cinerariifolium]
MDNTHTDAELSAAVQNALQTLLSQIHAKIREEFRTSSGPLDSSGNPPLVTIHTWLEHFNKQKPHSFEKATAPVDAENWISHMEKILMSGVVRMHSRLDWLCTSLRVMHLLGGKPISKPKERLKREYHSIRQTDTETSTEFMQRFLRLAGFLGAAAGTVEEKAKNFQWGLSRSTLNHLMCIPFMDVAQVANAARNYEILYERDDDDAERPDKRRVVIEISRPLNRVVTGTTVIIMTVMDQTGEAVVTTTTTTTTTLATTTGVPVMGVTREKGVSSPTDLSILVFRSPGVPLRATPTRSALRVDADTQESVVELLVPASSVVKLAICRRIARRTAIASTSGQADKKP